MSNLNEMWEALAQYQPYADRRGFGNEWRKMTTERTKKAAYIATDAAAGQAEDAAAWAADSAGVAVCDAPKAEENSSANWAQRAINFIREAIGHNEAALRQEVKRAP